MATLQQIIAYINQHKARFTFAILRDQLLKQNVPPQVIDEAIKLASGSASAPPPSAGPPPAARPGQTQPIAPPGQPPVVDEQTIGLWRFDELLADEQGFPDASVTAAPARAEDAAGR